MLLGFFFLLFPPLFSSSLTPTRAMLQQRCCLVNPCKFLAVLALGCSASAALSALWTWTGLPRHGPAATPASVARTATTAAAAATTAASSSRCSSPRRELRFLEPPGPVVALASFPGSGNTWTRHLLQQATGAGGRSQRRKKKKKQQQQRQKNMSRKTWSAKAS